MFNFKSLHQDESGQTALETAIILIAFVVVASVFAFTILSAGSSSTEKGEAAIYSGLENVQSSIAVKGAVVANGDAAEPPTQVDKVVFTVALASGNEPLDLTASCEVTEGTGGAPDTCGAAPALATTKANAVVVGYRDASQSINELPWVVNFIGQNDGDNMLEDGELAEITVSLTLGGGKELGANTEFTLEVKPPSGAVLNITRTTPAAIEPVMELR